MRHRSAPFRLSFSFVLAAACGLSVSACFAPEDATPSRGGGGICVELDEPCAVNGDCCDFEPTAAVGTALCVDDGTQAACTDVCTADGDCGSGCCGQLTDQTGYGACMDASVCAAGYGFGSPDACLRGVEVFCDCGTQLDVPCEDQAGYAASCADPADSGVNAIFQCFAAFDADQCGAALDACG